jgi:hypothetical protein
MMSSALLRRELLQFTSCCGKTMQGVAKKLFRLPEAPIAIVSSHSGADARRRLQSAAVKLDHSSCPTGAIENWILVPINREPILFSALAQEREARERTMISYNGRSPTAPVSLRNGRRLQIVRLRHLIRGKDGMVRSVSRQAKIYAELAGIVDPSCRCAQSHSAKTFSPIKFQNLRSSFEMK